MINFPAPAEPPMRATMRLGIIARHLVRKFLTHGTSFRSRKPCVTFTYCPAYVPVIVELRPEARSAMANSFELHLPTTFCLKIEDPKQALMF